MTDEPIKAIVERVDDDRQAVRWLNSIGTQATCQSCQKKPALMLVAFSWNGWWNELLCAECADAHPASHRVAHIYACRDDASAEWRTNRPGEPPELLPSPVPVG